MSLPFYMYCTESGANLYPLKDGRFQKLTDGKIVPLMTGFGYVLVETKFAEYLQDIDLPNVEFVDATIYDPKSKMEINSHRQLKIGQYFTADMIHNINLDGLRLLLMGDMYLFVSPKLKENLENSDFKYLKFSVGLSEFAGYFNQ